MNVWFIWSIWFVLFIWLIWFIRLISFNQISKTMKQTKQRSFYAVSDATDVSIACCSCQAWCGIDILSLKLYSNWDNLGARTC